MGERAAGEPRSGGAEERMNWGKGKKAKGKGTTTTRYKCGLVFPFPFPLSLFTGLFESSLSTLHFELLPAPGFSDHGPRTTDHAFAFSTHDPRSTNHVVASPDPASAGPRPPAPGHASPEEEPPPLGRSWAALYAAVAGFLAVLIALFALFTRAFE